MKIQTKIFGEVEIADNKIITFDKGIIGFPELKHFTMLHDEEKGSSAGIRYLQSIEEPGFAMPVMDPLLIKEAYNPKVEDELLKPLGEFGEDDMLVLVTVSVPADIKNMTANMKGPIVINTSTKKAVQVIAEGDDCEVKLPIYEMLKARRAGA